MRSEHFPSARRCVGKCFHGESTAENETHSAHLLRTHDSQHLARGMPVAWELSSRVDGCCLSEQLRVRAECRWRVTPSLSSCLCPLSTHSSVRGDWNLPFSGTPRRWVKSEHSAPTWLYLHRQARAQRNNLREFVRTSSRNLYFRTYWDVAGFFFFAFVFVLLVVCLLYFCICSSRFVSVGVFVYSCARVSVRSFLFRVCNFGRGSGQPREPWRRHPNCSVQTYKQK